MIQVKSRRRYEYYTPLKIINMAREVMGDIDLDPATSEMAQSHVEARKYYTIEDDGLQQEWAGRVWLNPPFDSANATRFIQKLTEGILVTEYVLLTCGPTDGRWLQIIAADADLMCLPKIRPKFWTPKTNKWKSPAPIWLWYRGTNGDKFREVFEKLGVVR